MSRYDSKFSTRDSFGRSITIEPSKLTGSAAHVYAPDSNATLTRAEAESAAKALLAASGSRLRVVDALTASYYYERPQRHYLGQPVSGLAPVEPYKPAPSAAILREALRLAVEDGAEGEAPGVTTRRARAYAEYLSEGK